MNQASQKRESTNPDSESTGQGRKKSKIEVCIDTISDEDIQIYGTILHRALTSEDYFRDFFTHKRYDCNLDDIDPKLPEENLAEENIIVEHIEDCNNAEENMVEENMADKNITEVFIVTSDKAKRSIDLRTCGRRCRNKVILIIFLKLPNDDNILKKFKKVEKNSKKPLNKNNVKPANIRSNLSCSFIRFVKKIINNWPKLINKPFEGTGENKLQSAAFKTLKDFILNNKSVLQSFNPLGSLPKKPKTKPQDGKSKGYNNFINIDQLIDYFVDPIIRKAFHLYVDFLLAGVTSKNLIERVGFCPIDPSAMNIEELSNFFKDMCIKVIYAREETKEIEGNVLKFIGEGNEVMSFNLEDDKSGGDSSGVDNAGVASRVENEVNKSCDSDKVTQRCTVDVSGKKPKHFKMNVAYFLYNYKN